MNEGKEININLGHWPFGEICSVSFSSTYSRYVSSASVQSACVQQVQKTGTGIFLLCEMVESWISLLCYLYAPNFEKIILKIESRILFGREMSSAKNKNKNEMRKATLKICLIVIILRFHHIYAWHFYDSEFSAKWIDYFIF